MTRHEENIFLREHSEDAIFQKFLNAHPYANVSDVIFLYQHAGEVDEEIMALSTKENLRMFIEQDKHKLVKCGEDIIRAEYLRGRIEGMKLALYALMKEQLTKKEIDEIAQSQVKPNHN